MTVLIDNGHGVETPGKRSPDGRLREYAYTREIANRVIDRLHAAGIDARRIVPEETDIPLAERVRRANREHAARGNRAILVSIHCNAAQSGSTWESARGWSIFVDVTASAASKRLATTIAKAAESRSVTVRRQKANCNYWEQSLYICKHTICPAVLVENFFQDNREDVELLLSEPGRQLVTDIIVEGVKNYLNAE